MPRGSARRTILPGTLLAAACILAGCERLPGIGSPPATIAFTKVPPADQGGTELVDDIAGRVTGAAAGQRVVLFARSGGTWWVQPGPTNPYTAIASDGTFAQSTHLGTEYAALLVDPAYKPPYTTAALPPKGGSVIAVVTIEGPPSRAAPRKILKFGGYEWIVRASPSDRGGMNRYDPANASVDEAGALHLRLTKGDEGWLSTQVILSRSLGYGTYTFTVRGAGRLDPAVVLTFYTLDLAAYAGAAQNPREWDVEFSRWGEPAAPNARFVVQPASDEGRNVHKFTAPDDVLTVTVRWEAGRAAFKAVRGTKPGGAVVAEHVFTASVPEPGEERFRINLYDYQRGSQRVQKGAEVVVDAFTFMP
jgi:hypothetical protein